MKKPDEIALYAFLRTEHSVCAPQMSCCSTDDAARALGIHPKRAHYLVEKWIGNAWCDGVSTRYVYFYLSSPAALLPWGVVQ
jgi:hypothetical protein